MNWHELNGNGEISVNDRELLVRRKVKSNDYLLDDNLSDIKRIPLFEVKETARFNWDSREVWIELRGSYYYFSSTETLLQFVDLIQQQFPESVLKGRNEVGKYPYKPQIAALIVLTICLIIGLTGNTELPHTSGSAKGQVFDTLLSALRIIPDGILISVYCGLSALAITRIVVRSGRLKHEKSLLISRKN